jgi:hypothetical protein
MTGKAGLKAGLIGAAAIFVLTLLNQISIPGVGCVCCPLTLLAYAGIGVLAGYFLVPPRTPGTGAGAGAIAGLVSGAVGGIIWIIALIIQMATTDAADIMANIPPDTLRQLTELGVDPDMIAMFSGAGGAALAGGMCCLTGLAVGAGLGAIGGAIFSATKPE